MEKYDCFDCKHFECDDEKYPCNSCKGTASVGSSAYLKRPLLFEEYCNEKASNSVSHPAHYTHGKYECIEVMEDCFGKETVRHFCLLNAFKYIWRSEHKNGAEDIEKARWYLDKYLGLEGDDNEKDG